MNVELWRRRFAEYLGQTGFRPRSVETYVGELSSLFEFLDAVGVKSLAEVTRLHLEEYRSLLFHRDPPLKLTTQCLKMTSVHAFFLFLFRQNFLPADPSAGLPTVRAVSTHVRQVLSEEEAVRLLEATDTETPLGLRDRSILEVFYSSGIRNTELRNLKIPDLDSSRSQLRVIDGKGGKSRVVPLGQLALSWTQLYLERSRPLLARDASENHLFLSWRGKVMERASLAKLVTKAGEAAGITWTVTPHILRHSCATHMLVRQAGIRHLQELLGHSCLNSTQVYTRVEISQLQRVHRRFHPREQGLS